MNPIVGMAPIGQRYRLVVMVAIAASIMVAVSGRAAPPANVGAGDLFAALNEPDRVAEIRALRAIRQSLSAAADPRVLDDARAQLDALLDVEEKRQPDVPPALIMTTLAGRIDRAINGMEQVAHRQPAPFDAASLLFDMLFFAAAGSVCLAAGLGSLLAVLRWRRRHPAVSGDAAFDAAMSDIATAAARLSSTVTVSLHAQDGAAAATADATGAVQDATLAVARLAGATMDVQTRLRDCLVAAELRQAEAVAVAVSCERAALDLPALIAGAIEAIEARGLPKLSDAADRLEKSSTAIAATAASVPAQIATALRVAESQAAATIEAHGVAAIDTAAAHFGDSTARLAEHLAELPAIAAVAAQLEQSAGRLTATAALLDEGGRGISLVAAGLPAAAAALGECTDLMADSGAAQATAMGAIIDRAERLSSVLPDMISGLASATAALRREAQLEAQTLAEGGATLARATSLVEYAGGTAESCIAHLDTLVATHASAAAMLTVAATDVREAAAAARVALTPRQSAMPGLSRLGGLAAETQALLDAAGALAESAAHGEARGLSRDMLAEMPALLATIETSILRLRGTAAALATASDAARLAA